MAERVLRSEKDGLCTLTLNRPEKLNALDTDIFLQLDAHLSYLENAGDAIGCVVLQGAGRAFCAGADLGRIGDGSAPAEFKPRVIERLGLLPQPVIAAVHGVCYTGGLELALACDLIIADTSARFRDTHGKWGLVSQWGMTQRLPRRVGTAKAKYLMMTASEVTSQEALSIGLIDQTVAAGELGATVEMLARSILDNSWHTNMAVKRLLRETEAMSLSDGLLYEQRHHPGFAPDYRDRVARFSRK